MQEFCYFNLRDLWRYVVFILVFWIFFREKILKVQEFLNNPVVEFKHGGPIELLN